MKHIPPEERDIVYDAAIKTFGDSMQLVVALEEFSEIQKEICKALRGNYNPHHLAEEVADATIMLEQIRKVFNIGDIVDDIMDHKILRLQQRVAQADEAYKARLDAVLKCLES